MYISPVDLYNKQNSIRSNFRGITNTINKKGVLDTKTSSMMQDIMRAYRDIEEKLSKITLQGKKALLDQFPNFEITDSMTFMNCGDEKYPIIINRASDYHSNRGLVKIVTRKGSGEWTKREPRDSFVIENAYHILKDADTNNQRHFPKERIYLTGDELNSNEVNTKLNKIFSDLDRPLLEIRKYLSLNMQKYLKAPDGTIPYNTNREFYSIENIFSELSDMYKKFPHKKLLAMKHEYPNLSLISGQQYPVFQNLGQDNLKIGFAPVETFKADGLYRMQVYDNEGKTKRIYTIKDNKFIKNIKERENLYIPDFFSYVDSNEINDEAYLPEFNKYLALYKSELDKYKAHVINYLKKREEVHVSGEFDTNTTQKLEKIHSVYKEIKSAAKKLPPEVISFIKREYKNYKQTQNRHGIVFQDFENHKEFFYFPLRSNVHSNLLRLSITDTVTNRTKSYLIHNDKYVVKNYNPSYTMLPKTLVYMTSDELEDTEIKKYLSFIEEQMSGFNDKISAYHKCSNRNSEAVKTEKDAIRRAKSSSKKIDESQKKLIQECVSMLKNTLTRELSYGMTNVEVTLSDIRKKVHEYLQTTKG